MKFTKNWLKEWIALPDTVETWTEKLTLAGLEVESVSAINADFSKVYVGEVLSVVAHPNADRLKLCQVDVGDRRPLEIICGASNVHSGMKVAVAKVGAILPGNVRIKRSKIRGVVSHGMLCAAKELHVDCVFTDAESQEDGIMELPSDAPSGELLCNYLELPDQLVDVNVTPNRGDCLSISGISRELSGIMGYAVAPMYFKESVSALSEDEIPLRVHAKKACPRYLGRVIRNIRTNAITPTRIKQRLYYAQISAIHPVVDIMNYVMLELGQPLHAFDLSHVSGEVQVRYAKTTEQITLLDTTQRHLDKNVLVIADSKKVLALAGIMGGQESAVSDHTTDIFIESAFFTPDAIAPTNRAFGINSEAAYRFERGVDPELARVAMHRATELLLSICEGKVGPVVVREDSASLPQPKKILVRTARVSRVLGYPLHEAQIENLLHRINLFTQPDSQGRVVHVPSYRFDLNIEADIIEEIARLHGYDHIPATTMTAPVCVQPTTKIRDKRRIADYFVNKGYFETIQYSFVSEKWAHMLGDAPLPLSNPISAQFSIMRTTLWCGLIEAALFNQHRQQSHMRFFEMGPCYYLAGIEIKEVLKLAGIAVQADFKLQWQRKQDPINFFSVKGDLEGLFALTRRDDFVLVPDKHPALHPGQCAKIMQGDNVIGWQGALHPSLGEKLSLPADTYLFELTLDPLLEATSTTYAAFSKYPCVRRDFAFVVPLPLSYAQVLAAVKDAVTDYENCASHCIDPKEMSISKRSMLKGIQLFDVYTGAGVPEGQKSIALRLTFQLQSETLDEVTLEALTKHITDWLGDHFGFALRQA